MSKLIYPELSYIVQGAFYEVYNELRHYELSEAGWEEALSIVLAQKNILAERQVEQELRYKGQRIGRFFLDVLIERKLLLELKATTGLIPINEAQVIAYLKVAGLKLGVLVNFGETNLEIKRIPNFMSERPRRQPSPITSQDPDHLLYPELTGLLRSILYEVHRELGSGFVHMHYRRAVQIELKWRDIPYDLKKEITIHFRGQPIETRETRLLVIDKKILLTPIAVRQITPELIARFRQYLNILGLKIGLIANFHGPSLEIEVVRIQQRIAGIYRI